MRTFKTLDHLEQRLKKGICWGDWIKVNDREYKMVEYGDTDGHNYMMFQNKPTTNIIYINYQVPCFKSDGENGKIQTKQYSFIDIEEYKEGALYRY